MQLSRPKWLHRYAVAILFLPVLVLWHRDNALFTPAWFTDPWYYLGYFRTLLDFKRELFPDAYFGSRLSWILPGFVVHWLFSPLPANFVLHTGVHLMASFSFFAILRRTSGERAAFLSTLVFSLHPWLWAATGWDYVNGAGIAYLLCTLAALTKAAEPGAGRAFLIAAGAGIAGMVYAHFLWLSMAPLLLLYYAGLSWAWRSERVLASLSRGMPEMAGGFALVTAALGMVNYAVEGDFWFYRLSWDAAMRAPEVFTTAPRIWGAHGLEPWLWFPLIAAALGAILLPVRMKNQPLRECLPALLLSAQLLLAAAWMGYLQTRGIAMLGFYHYAAYLLPYAFLGSCAVLWDAVKGMSERTYLATCGLTAAGFAIIWYEPPVAGWTMPAWLAAAMCAIPFALGVPLRRHAAGTWLTCAGFLLLSAHGATQTASLHGTREQYRRIMEARGQVEQARNHDRVRFWFDEFEAGSDDYFALNSVYLDMRLGRSFPQTDCKVPVQPGTLIVIPSAREDAATLAQQELSNCWHAASMKPVMVARHAVARQGMPYSVVLLRAATDLTTHRALQANVEKDSAVRLQVAPDGATCPLPMLWKKETPDTLLQANPAGIEVRTQTGAYDYAIAYAPVVVPLTGRYRFALRYAQSSGEFAFGAFPADNSRWLATNTTGYRDGDAREIAFTVALKAGEATVLRVANNNNHRNGKAASFRLLQLTATLADAR